MVVDFAINRGYFAIKQVDLALGFSWQKDLVVTGYYLAIMMLDLAINRVYLAIKQVDLALGFSWRRIL